MDRPVMYSELNGFAKKTVLKRALQYVAMMKRRWSQYQEEVDIWYRSGEGKTRGYTFPECFHGASLWTDYDNICGGCEDGFNGYNPLEFYRWAFNKAMRDYREMRKRSNWFCSAPPELFADEVLYRRIIDWCMEPVREVVENRD